MKKKYLFILLTVLFQSLTSLAGGIQIAHCVELDNGQPTTSTVDLFQGMPDAKDVAGYYAVMSDTAKSTVGYSGLLGPVAAPMILGSSQNVFTLNPGAQDDFGIQVTKGHDTVGTLVVGGHVDLKCDVSW